MSTYPKLVQKLLGTLQKYLHLFKKCSNSLKKTLLSNTSILSSQAHTSYSSVFSYVFFTSILPPDVPLFGLSRSLFFTVVAHAILRRYPRNFKTRYIRDSELKSQRQKKGAKNLDLEFFQILQLQNTSEMPTMAGITSLRRSSGQRVVPCHIVRRHILYCRIQGRR